MVELVHLDEFSPKGSLIITSVSRTPSAGSNDSPVGDLGSGAILSARRVRTRPGSTPVAFVLRPGDLLVIAGPAGVGKTGLLETIGLATPPPRGDIELFEHDLKDLTRREQLACRRRMGLVFQTPRLIEDASARDNITLGALAAGRTADEVGDDVDQLMAWVGLTALADRAAQDLNDEARRRVAMARALVNRPELIVADEPAGPDGSAVLRMLVEVNQAGTALLVATREPSQVDPSNDKRRVIELAPPLAGSEPGRQSA